MSLPSVTREIQLASRPVGRPVPENFRLAESALPELGDGQILVRNLFISVDPYMRGRMNHVKSYSAPFALDKALDGGAVGEVLASRSSQHKEGDVVVHSLGWREYAVVEGGAATTADTGLAPASAFLGALGMTGLTAYAGLLKVAAFAPGDAVFVSGAAGAVGSLVGQIAKAMGASRVIGSAGSPAKVARLLELGFDAAFNYHDGPVREQLEKAAGPNGIDVYFDNVGGDHLEAAIGALRLHGRAAICGSISTYNAVSPPPGPRNLSLLVASRLTLRGFLVGDHTDLRPEFLETVSGWLTSGDLVVRETVREGLDDAVPAFLDLLRGGNTGKMIVRLAD
jgi:NADPH-dependent curcumin reductase CurA